ncbi:Cerato-platanin-domain-containing protein [Rhodofomes roseus]|uniref:Cerato-platanin-domain-containing protein n=1 Tax=Rhodofomes roseus TaxID=34475 RepID=A0ABQ8KHU8_9APHY|nr:Cerato-platanin-domain-containing protein [Rhodofomes roseus]KAH9837569.1 Cerato-platanin-domain-containing protein [Rhodofomes roseus]
MYHTLISAAVALFSGSLAFAQLPGPAVTVSYDTKYDVSTTPVSTLACASSLSNFTTFGALPEYPYIAGSDNVTDSSKTDCGHCYTLEYAGNFAQIQVVDSAAEGFVLSHEAYEWLTMNYTSDPSVTAYILNGPEACDFS